MNKPGRMLAVNENDFRVEKHAKKVVAGKGSVCELSICSLGAEMISEHKSDSEPYLRAARIHRKGKNHVRDPTIDLPTRAERHSVFSVTKELEG